MNRVGALNVVAFAAAVALSAVAAVVPLAPRSGPGGVTPGGAAEAVRAGAGSSRPPAPSYRRIVSTSTVADGILVEISEPDRVVAYAPHADHADAFRFAGKPAARLDDLEAILAFHPDLVLVSAVGETRALARLRETGIAVFDLGEPRGVETLVRNVRDVAALLGVPERGSRLAAAIVDTLRTIAADIPETRRPRGIYLGTYGGRFFGGGTGTSYHDVLVGGGLIDAARGYMGWPSYTPEQILQLDPDVVVTASGQRARICATPALEHLRACASARGLVEVEGALLSDPGPTMIDAARAVRTAVFGRPGASE